MIDAYASLRHYAAHIQPIWKCIPPEHRGTFWSPSRGEPWGQRLDATRDPSRLVLVASALDGRMMHGSRLVYVEHGAGQSYVGTDSPSYSGGPGHESVVLFLCPNEHVAARWRATYPDTRAEVVGCPWLDRWHVCNGNPRNLAGDPPTVAVSFHWDCGLCPETRSAWRYYDRALPGLARRWQLLGHGHPRLWPTIRGRWARLGVEQVPDFTDIMDRADLLVVDNSSAAYEFASTGRPVLLLNQPGYRRDVEHGLRFWSHPPGYQIDQPDQLDDGITTALDDSPALQAIRTAAVARAYDHVDGHATERAVTAIMETLENARDHE